MKNFFNFVKKFPFSFYAFVAVSLLMLSKIFNFQYDEPILGIVATIFGIGFGYMIESSESFLIEFNIISNSVKFDYFNFVTSAIFTVFIFLLLDLVLFHIIPKLIIKIRNKKKVSNPDTRH